MLRNISRKAPELSVNNAHVTLNPYLPQTVKQLKQIYIPEVMIHPATNDRAEKLRSDINPSFTSPTLTKKSKRLLKNYLQLNRTATTPQFSVEESESEEKSAGTKESSVPVHKISSERTKLKNGLLPVPSVYPDSTEKFKNREWNVRDFSIQATPQFTSRLNNSNSNNIINVYNLKSLNVSNDAVQSPPRYNVLPRPFSILQSPNSLLTTNIDASYRKPSSSPAGFDHQQQIARSSANVLPLVLPTDLFNPPARHYIPIKRTNHLNLERMSAAVVNTEASLPTSPVGERTTFANYDALHTAVISTTRSPLVTVSSQQNYGSSDYYAITESATEPTITKTNLAATYIPGQTSASHTVQRQNSQVTRKNDLLPKIASYNSPDDEKSSLNENPGIALYNKFANLHSTNIPNVFNVPRAITQNFRQSVQQPSQQLVSTLPYATLKPLVPTLLKVQPITITSSNNKPAPYYDSRLFASQDGTYNTNDENDETKEQSRIEDTDEKKNNDNNGDVGNYKTQINREAYKIYKTPNKQREKKHHEEEEEDRSPQQSRNYGYHDKDKHDKDDENDRSSKNDDRREKYEDIQENNDDEEEVDETEEEEYVSTGKNKHEDKEPRHQYNTYEYDRDNSNEEQREKPRYDHKKYDKSHRDKHESDVEHRFKNNNKYFESLHNNDDKIHEHKKHRNRSDKKKLVDNNQYKKDRQDNKYKESENENIAEDELFARRSKDQRAYRRKDERYEEKQSNNDDKRKVSPRRSSLREEHEKYGETNPAHTYEEYHHVNNDHPRHDNENQDDGKEEDHVHGETQEHAHKHEEHHEKKKDGGDHHFEKGGGAEHEEEHHEHKGEKGDKVNGSVCSSDSILTIANDLLFIVCRDIRFGMSTRRPRRGIMTKSMPANTTTRKMARRRNTRKRVDIIRSIIMAKRAKRQQNSARRVNTRRVTVHMANIRCTRR